MTTDTITQIAAREGITAYQVRILIACWCYPIRFAIPTAVDKARANDPSWRAWVERGYPAKYGDIRTVAESSEAQA